MEEAGRTGIVDKFCGCFVRDVETFRKADNNGYVWEWLATEDSWEFTRMSKAIIATGLFGAIAGLAYHFNLRLPSKLAEAHLPIAP